MTRSHLLRDPSGNVIGEILEHELYAIRNLLIGECSPDQQKRAYSIIIEKLSGADDLSFRPDEKGGERVSSFHEGRRYVGLQIRKLATAPVDRLIDLQKPKEQPNARSDASSVTKSRAPARARTRKPRA